MNVSLTFYDIGCIEEHCKDSTENVSEDNSEQDRCSGPDALCKMLENNYENQYRKTDQQVGRRAKVIVVVSASKRIDTNTDKRQTDCSYNCTRYYTREEFTERFEHEAEDHLEYASDEAGSENGSICDYSTSH